MLTAQNNCDSIIIVDLNYNNCFDCDQTRPNLGIQVMKSKNGEYQFMYGNDNFKTKKVKDLDTLIDELIKGLNTAKNKRPESSQLLLSEAKLRLMLKSMKPNSSIKL